MLEKRVQANKPCDRKLVAHLVDQGHAQSIAWKPTLRNACQDVCDNFIKGDGEDLSVDFVALEKIAIKRFHLKQYARALEQGPNIYDDMTDAQIEEEYSNIYGKVSGGELY